MGTRPTNERKQEIIDAYFDYFNAYTKRNWESMLKTFSKSITMFGTGIDEVSLSNEETLKFFTREFTQSPIPLWYNIKEIEVFDLCEDFAYLMILMDMEFVLPEEVIECPNNRTTAILAKENGQWKLVHGHWSQPAEDQLEGESIPYNLLKEKNRRLEEKVRARTIEIEDQNKQLKSLIDTKTKLLSIIAHDLRSPFNAFLGLTEVMLENFQENINKPDYFKSRLQLIYERAQSLYGVADNLLNWAWTQTDEIQVNFKVENIQPIVNEQVIALADNAAAKGVSIVANIPETAIAFTDKEILSIIIRNFVSNAIKYSYKDSKVEICSTQDEGRLLICIKDKGIGMSSEQLNTIQTTNTIESKPGTEREKGTGLGLIICKELTERIDGKLYFNSKEGEGTEVVISLPYKLD